MSSPPSGDSAVSEPSALAVGGEQLVPLLIGNEAPPVERIGLESLIHHRESVADDCPLEEVQLHFRNRDVDFLALVRQGCVTGVCSRTLVGTMLGSRFGFSLNSRSPAHSAQVPHPLIFTSDTPLSPILDQALDRRIDDFHEDVVLVDESHRLLGLIPVQVLARLQTRLVGQQRDAHRAQHEQAHRQNLELFQSNHALRQAQGLYRTLFESDATGVALLDLNGMVQAHNRRFGELINRRDATGGEFSLVQRVSERDQPRFRQLLSAHERGGPMAGAQEFHFETGERGVRLMRISTGWIRETSQICTCVDDVTEQRAIERHLQGQEKQLLLDTLVGGIAHELNNKLTPVLGFAQLVELEANERVRGYVGYINKSVIEAATIIRQLLQLAKPETGLPQLVDLGMLVDEAVTMLKFQLREARVNVRTQFPPEPVTIFADPSQLKQVVMNLIINAVHAMSDVLHPRLELSISRSGGVGQLDVLDNGAGIGPEVIERVFDPFFTTKSPDKGSGLGLSISQSLLRPLGGDIGVTSTLGRGARFTVSLPLAASDVGSKRSSAAPFVSGESFGIPAALRVLVVEDEDVVRRFLQEALRAGFGCRVDAAVDPAEALRYAELHRYSLVISDVRMPGMNGPEFYRRLCSLRPDMARRFVFVTGHAGEESLVALLREASVPVLAKPFTMQRLHEVCGPILRVPLEKVSLNEAGSAISDMDA